MTRQIAPVRIKPKSKFRADIQGLRAIAVGLVLLYHAGVPVLTGGYVGVDVFFVISGFLISTHLFERLEGTGRVGFADFYARRARRILPASLTVAVATMLASLFLYPPLAVGKVLRDGLATILYVPNIWFTIQNTDYLADHSPSPYQHYWSLGVEEQFYLFWPVLLLVLYLLLRRRSVRLGAVIAVLAMVSLVAGVVVTQANQPFAFFSLPTRAWQFMAGALVGMILLHKPCGVARWKGALLGWLGIAMIGASAVLYDSTTAFPGTAAIMPTLGTALVICAGASSPRGGPTRLLSIRPAQFIGEISYSLYLVHWPLLVVTQAAVGEETPLRLFVKVGLGVVLPLPLAWLLYRFIETPLRIPRALTDRRPRVTLIATLCVTLVLITVFAVALRWASVRVVGSGASVAAAPAFPKDPPDETTFVPSNLTPPLADVAEDVPVLYGDGCHLDATQEQVQHCEYGTGSQTIAVFGDSHSAQWFPAISDIAKKRGDTTVRAFTKSSCPAVDVTVANNDVPYTSCDRWRDAVLRQLAADPPALVVISSYAHYDLPSHGADRVQAWADGIRRTVQRLRAVGAQVLVIADTPSFASPPPTCVSANVTDVTKCDGRRSQVLDMKFAAAERAAVIRAGGSYVDLTRYICEAERCPVIVNDLLVYRDVNHLTTEFVRYLGPALAEPIGSGLR